MILYLSAPHSNWMKDAMDIYLAGSFSRPYAVKASMDCYLSGPHADYGSIWRLNRNQPDKAMEIYLAIGGGGSGACYRDHDTSTYHGHDNTSKIAILESFYYIQEWMFPYIHSHWQFLLDSGAFTFMTGKKTGSGIDWDEYVDRYAEFIVAHQIELFFELDIDNVVGLQRVERLRSRLEQKTGRQPIPVWHKSRGKAAFLAMCQNYHYVALGGIVAKEWTRDEYLFFPWFIDTAHKYQSKIHGLGFTTLSLLPKFHFDSVDSTSWVYGNRAGCIYVFNGKTLTKHDRKDGERLTSAKATAIHNFREWVKFQQYARRFL